MERQIKGVVGKILIVDLNTGVLKVEEPEDELYLNYLGGYGLGAYYLFKNQKPGVDPLGPENMLGFFTGILTGTKSFSSGRYMVVSKSPKTGTWGDANCGGSFGHALKVAGFDAVLFKGQSKKPVYIMVDNGEVELKDASDLWGMDTTEVEETLIEKHGKVSLACIGPSGERQSLLSCIITDKGRAAGRSGLGAVMGSKKLKAVVATGKLPIPVADPERMSARRKDCLEFIKKDNDLYGMFHDYGTCSFTMGAIMAGDAPIKNFSGAAEDFKEFKKTDGDSLISYQKKRYTCWGCAVSCGGYVQLEGKTSHKPQYETIVAFGGLCLNNDVESIIKVNDICNRYGMDALSAGVTVAFAIECCEKGLITKDDIGGLDLKWGNSDAIIELTEMMAKGEGFGRVLMNGSKVAAESIGQGAEELAMNIQGEEIPMHDIRCSPGLATSYKTDGTPGRHCQSGSWHHEIQFIPAGLDYPKPKYEDKYKYSGKAKTHRFLNHFVHTVNCAGLCQFGFACIRADDLPEFLSAASGVEFDMDMLQEIGERIATIRLAFNIREGILPGTVKIPDRAYGNPPLDHGVLKDVKVDVKTQVKEYFKEMGWDERTGTPSKERLCELGLDFVAQEI